MRDARIIQGNLIASGARSFTRKIFSFNNNIDILTNICYYNFVNHEDVR